MKLTRSAVVKVAVMVGSLAAVSVTAAEPTIKELMGENFAGLQTILVSLITSDYTPIPAQADVIRDHAMQLTKVVPKSAEGERDRFLAMAYALDSNAASLKSIAEILMQHDRERLAKTGNLLGVDELREALAGHYAGMVVTCVSCHNHYRPGKLAQ